MEYIPHTTDNLPEIETILTGMSDFNFANVVLFPKKLECKFVSVTTMKCSVDKSTVRVACTQLFLLLVNSDVEKQKYVCEPKVRIMSN